MTTDTTAYEDDLSSSKPAIDEGEFTSVYAEADTASFRSSEATVNQPLAGDFKDKADAESNVVKNGSPNKKQNSTYKLFQHEDAAMIIQSTYRRFLDRRANERMKLQDCKADPVGSPSRESMGTSIEVRLCYLHSTLCTGYETWGGPHMSHKLEIPTFSHPKKKAWPCNIPHDIEVDPKCSSYKKTGMIAWRERALAYAFSQQLRICSKKKQIKSNSNEIGVGWSWLEQWMATRLLENTMMEDQLYKQIEAVRSHQTTGITKRVLDVAMEEKESCGSNDVSLRIEVGSVAAPKDVPRPTRNRNKTMRNISKRDAASSYLYPTESKVHLSAKPKIVQRNK
ncbi:IQ-DOMAIN 1-like [Olea europaea subsp. europaea]|uniref:IQ-DOMAIN 1-like n=1 Tax=Olea europaea subsp. europaea TaxID=158383 RepID=A0A8S0PKS6_OLEEU|nr:IQ-DOMAIN 1-like [Olea europaea subsp. europaea]